LGLAAEAEIAEVVVEAAPVDTKNDVKMSYVSTVS
jgi:hypothetical protein